MLRNPFTKALWDGRRSLLGWALAIAGVTVLYSAFYPSMRNPQLSQAMASYPESMRKAFHMQDMASAAGYLGSTVFGILVPILVVIFAIAAGSRAVAGDEEAGTLDLLLAHPVGRIRLLLSRFAALIVQLLLINAAAFVALLAISGPAQLSGVSVAEFGAVVLQVALLGVCFGALAIAVGAATGRRALVFGVGAGVAVVAYFADSVAPQISGLSWLQKASPFHWYAGGEALRSGLQLGGCALLIGVAAILVALGVAAFRGRDLAV
jgi:ABC-2 type transport system permease protein